MLNKKLSKQLTAPKQPKAPKQPTIPLSNVEVREVVSILNNSVSLCHNEEISKSVGVSVNELAELHKRNQELEERENRTLELVKEKTFVTTKTDLNIPSEYEGVKIMVVDKFEGVFED